MRSRLGLAVLLVAFGAMNASADGIGSVVYNDIPTGLTTNSSNDFNNSLPFYAAGVSEFGGLITLAGANAATLTGGTVALSNWAAASLYDPTSADTVTGSPGNYTGYNGTGYYANVTVNLYSQGTADGGNPINGDNLYAVGSLIQSSVTNVFIDWRPATDPSDLLSINCNGNPLGGGGSNPNSYSNGGNEQCGAVNLVNFNLSAPVPSTFIYTVSVNTGTSVPTNSLNFGLNPYTAQDPGYPGLTGIGTTDPDTAYYNGPSSLYSSLVPYTPDIVQGDTGWGNYGYGAIAFNGVPEPATFGLIGFGLVGLGIVARRKTRKKKTNL